MTQHLVCLGYRKRCIPKKFKENKSLQQAQVFYNSNATQAQIDKAGEAAFVVMYNGKKSDTLDFDTKSIVTSWLQALHKWTPIHCLLAAKFHSRRVFLQVNQWKGDLLAEE